jgi:hypothetical protein
MWLRVIGFNHYSNETADCFDEASQNQKIRLAQVIDIGGNSLPETSLLSIGKKSIKKKDLLKGNRPSPRTGNSPTEAGLFRRTVFCLNRLLKNSNLRFFAYASH